MTVETVHPADRAADLTVRKATGEDLPKIVETMTAAFFDDPVFAWWIPNPERRRVLAPRFFDLVVDVNHPHDELYLTDPLSVAAAVWVPPGAQPAGDEAEETVGWFVEAAEETADRLVCAFELMTEHHPEEPHAYLFLLGTQPAWQSRGLGSALLRQVLDRCDRDGTPAYLEATTLANQRLYLRHGFELTGEIPLPDGPSLWPMWREPRSSGR
jgi:ribosomal protein S18 acetylase RimI-like enzyme